MRNRNGMLLVVYGARRRGPLIFPWGGHEHSKAVFAPGQCRCLRKLPTRRCRSSASTVRKRLTIWEPPGNLYGIQWVAVVQVPALSGMQYQLDGVGPQVGGRDARAFAPGSDPHARLWGGRSLCS